MTVVRVPVRPMQEVLLCECGAEMEYHNAHIWIGEKPQFLHGCPKCHAEQYADKIYPEVVYERLEDSQTRRPLIDVRKAASQ